MARTTTSHTGAAVPIATIDQLLAVSMGFHVEVDNDITSKFIVTINPVKMVNIYTMPKARQDMASAMAVNLIEHMEEKGVLGMHSHVDVSMETIDPETRNPLLPDSQQLWRIEVTIPTDDVPAAQALANQYNKQLEFIKRTGNMLQ